LKSGSWQHSFSDKHVRNSDGKWLINDGYRSKAATHVLSVVEPTDAIRNALFIVVETSAGEVDETRTIERGPWGATRFLPAQQSDREQQRTGALSPAGGLEASSRVIGTRANRWHGLPPGSRCRGND
jgi:hypothetical protein